MASESTTPHYPDPCQNYVELYQNFLDNPEGCELVTPQTEPSTTSSSDDGPSMLVTGFGLRNWDSLQRALLDDEQRRQMLLAKYATEDTFECESLLSATKLSLDKSKSTTSEDEIPKMKSLSLEYLMGLAAENVCEEGGIEEEEGTKKRPVKKKVEVEEDRPMTQAMRKARKYLSEHHICEFFQFLTAHMLGALPDNPIEYLIDLLDKCILYRSGFSYPPLIFDKKHIEQLFKLMDRMETGFITMEQYKNGMKTLGAHSYDKNPPLSSMDLIAKDFFIEEVYDTLTDQFVEMIRIRGTSSATPSPLSTPPPTAVDVASIIGIGISGDQ